MVFFQLLIRATVVARGRRLWSPNAARQYLRGSFIDVHDAYLEEANLTQTLGWLAF